MERWFFHVREVNKKSRNETAGKIAKGGGSSMSLRLRTTLLWDIFLRKGATLRKVRSSVENIFKPNNFVASCSNSGKRRRKLQLRFNHKHPTIKLPKYWKTAVKMLEKIVYTLLATSDSNFNFNTHLFLLFLK